MEENDEKKNKCYRCEFFDGYYVKGDKKFNRAKYGFCRNNRSVVENCDECGAWRLQRNRNYTNKRAASRALYDIFTQLTAIRQVFEELAINEEENI